MNTQHLRHFLVAARLLNMHKASEQLNISQPGLSRSINALESYLGLPLFSRSGRRLALTEYGAALVPRAEVLVNQRDATISELRALYTTGLGTVRLAANAAFSDFFLPDVVSAALRDGVASRVDVFTEGFNESMRRLRSGAIDFVLSIAFPKPALRSPEFVYRPLFSVGVSVYTSNTSLSPDTELTDAELARYEWCSLEFEAIDGFVEYFRSRDIDPPHIAVNCNSIQFLLKVLHARHFLTILPDAIVESQQRLGAELRRVRCGVPLSGGQGGVIYRENCLLTKAAREVIQRIADSAPGAFLNAASAATHSRQAAC